MREHLRSLSLVAYFDRIPEGFSHWLNAHGNFNWSWLIILERPDCAGEVPDPNSEVLTSRRNGHNISLLSTSGGTGCFSFPADVIVVLQLYNVIA